MCEEYLINQHKTDIINILDDSENNKHYSININFLQLFENNPSLGNNVLNNPEHSLDEWDKAVISVQFQLKQDTKFILKNNVHCRIYGLPVCPELHRVRFPENDDYSKFLQVSGTVIRMSASKMLEYERQYTCTKCKFVMIVPAEYDKQNIIIAPKKCSNPDGCKSTNIITCGEFTADFCKDYQEIKIQENVSKLGVGTIPNSMWVTLEDDLVDICKPGDNVTICGIVKRRWGLFCPGKKIDIELALKANHIQVNNVNGSMMLITPDLRNMFEQFWETYSNSPLIGRDTILKSFCPQIFGLHIVKLAMAVVLAGGSHVPCDTSTGVNVRSESHLLLVGDPGTGKSQLLRFASKIIPRSVLTTGVGSTAAGLTVTAVMENGEWQLEGGALVLSDGGICCIDEFNSMKEHDRTSIHEAMEQQTISVAKASIVCKLSTKCSILAATNPKGNIDPSQPLNMNVALPSPLLSRFDLVLLIRDVVNKDWDKSVVDYVLRGKNHLSKLTENVFWSIDTLQAYFAIIKKNHPTLTSDSKEILSTYYQTQRQANSRNKARTTVRLLDSLVRLSQGHARLMFHKEVEIIDAVFAVVLVEISMEPDSSVLHLKFDVHSSFPENPMQAYLELVQIVLSKLELNELLEKEREYLNKKCSIILNSNDDNNKIIKYKTESKYFQLRTNQTSTHESNVEMNNKEQNNSEKYSLKNLKYKRNKSGGNDKPNKKFKFGNENSDISEKTSVVSPVNDLINESTRNIETSIFNEEPTRTIKDKTITTCTNNSNKNLNDTISKPTENNETTNKKSECNDNESNKSTSEENVINDLQALKCLPSVNDEFCFENLLNDESRQSTQITLKTKENSDVTKENTLETSSLVNNVDSESVESDFDDDLRMDFNIVHNKPKTKSFLNPFRLKESEENTSKELNCDEAKRYKAVAQGLWIYGSICGGGSSKALDLDF